MSSPLYLVTGAMGHLGNIVIGKLRQQEPRCGGLPCRQTILFPVLIRA